MFYIVLDAVFYIFYTVKKIQVDCKTLKDSSVVPLGEFLNISCRTLELRVSYEVEPFQETTMKRSY